MSLWNMSISGGIFIAAVIIARSLLRERLQGWVFQVLWLAVLFRLLVPFSIPCQLSVYTLADRCGLNVFVGESSGNRVDGTGIDGNGVAAYEGAETGGESVSAARIEDAWESSVAVHTEDAWESGAVAHMEDAWASGTNMHFLWLAVYLCGAFLFTLYYLLACLNWRRKFKVSFAADPAVQAYVETLPLRRKISVRQWEKASSPLTYGIFHPVILLPQALEEEDMEQLRMVLVHEYMHIRHYDAVKKMLLILACCIHWFNPLVWVMSVLANRDMEIACDENVIKYLGRDMRRAYARALIDMEEQRDIPLSLGNGFSKNALEERVIAIMKEKNKSIVIGVVSGLMATGLIMVFTTSAYAIGRAEKTVYVQADEVAAEESIPGEVAVDESDAIAFAVEGGVNEESIPGNVAVDASDDVVFTVEDGAAEESIPGDVAVNTSDAIAFAVENGAYDESDSVPDIDKEYAAYGITADPHTACWLYKGKKVAVFYDKDKFLSTNDVPEKNAVYLEVCRDKKGRIEEIREHSKKEMQKLLKHTGLVF